jgi:hypothetical protein
MFVVFVDWKPSAKVYTLEKLDQVLVQLQNMADYEYKNAKISKSKICKSFRKLKPIWYHAAS